MGACTNYYTIKQRAGQNAQCREEHGSNRPGSQKSEFRSQNSARSGQQAVGNLLDGHSEFWLLTSVYLSSNYQQIRTEVGHCQPCPTPVQMM
jgi:hypothetical protein